MVRSFLQYLNKYCKKNQLEINYPNVYPEFCQSSKSRILDKFPFSCIIHIVRIYIYIPLIRDKIHNSLKIAQLNSEQLSVARICTQPRENGKEEEEGGRGKKKWGDGRNTRIRNKGNPSLSTAGNGPY